MKNLFITILFVLFCLIELMAQLGNFQSFDQLDVDENYILPEYEFNSFDENFNLYSIQCHYSIQQPIFENNLAPIREDELAFIRFTRAEITGFFSTNGGIADGDYIAFRNSMHNDKETLEIVWCRRNGTVVKDLKSRLPCPESCRVEMFKIANEYFVDSKTGQYLEQKICAQQLLDIAIYHKAVHVGIHWNNDPDDRELLLYPIKLKWFSGQRYKRYLRLNEHNARSVTPE